MKVVRLLIIVVVIVLPVFTYGQGRLVLQSMSMADTAYTVKPDAAGLFVFKHTRADSYQLRLYGPKSYFDSRPGPITITNVRFDPATAPAASMSGNPPVVTITTEMLKTPLRDETTREDYFIVIYSGLKTDVPARLEGHITGF